MSTTKEEIKPNSVVPFFESNGISKEPSYDLILSMIKITPHMIFTKEAFSLKIIKQFIMFMASGLKDKRGRYFALCCLTFNQNRKNPAEHNLKIECHV